MSKTPAERRQAWIAAQNKIKADRAARNLRITLENMQPVWAPKIIQPKEKP
jgi:hypothetical protein